ncbi:MAG: YfiR family protein [Methylococcales bacterium]|nr:YfiR family protein [Methylococcales bacterium]
MKSICSILVLFCLLCSLFLRDSYAESAPVDEYKIKVGYLFNFTKFITWTEETTETFNICILGNDPFGEIIDPIEQRTAFNLPIKLFRLTVMDKAVHCHIVYVGSNVSAKTLAASSKNTLTVGEEPEFISQGGMIAFVKRQDKIKLQVNLKLLQQSGLKISAKLLEVVEIVGGDHND